MAEKIKPGRQADKLKKVVESRNGQKKEQKGVLKI